jgi:hypothetical protein
MQASTAEVFEAELSRNPYGLHTWLGYLASCGTQPARVRLALYDRAVTHLPGSYKLWMAYVQEAVKEVRAGAAVRGGRAPPYRPAPSPSQPPRAPHPSTHN